ncbi:MAG: DciA family protein [Pseudomonadota bacterium]
MTNNPTKLRKLLGADARLKHLLVESSNQEKLLKQITELLSSKLAPHCTAARCQGTTLTLYVDSSAWASRARFEVFNILPSLGLRNLRVTVTAPPAGKVQAPKPPQTLSAQAAETLSESARWIKDPGIAAVLRRIAAHRRR